ncbi:MAG TPA: hypothetical protein PKN33_18650 [Phycisphaerae bacterium]|nr:hypothetical protein [Phycisphaerae bacterium]
MHRLPLLLIALSAGNLSGCRPPSNDANNQDGTLPDTTKILDTATLDALQSVSPDHVTFQFDKATSQLASLKIGDIIVSDIHEPLLPYGTLRRVENVTINGGDVTVTTGIASLTDAVESGSIHTTIALDSDDIVNTTGVLRASRTRGSQLVLNLVNVVLYDGDGDTSGTTNDQILVDGNLSFEPDLVIDIDIDGFVLKTAKVELAGTGTASLSFEARRAAILPPAEFVIGSLTFAPVSIPLGPIIVVFVPVVELRAGIDGTFGGEMIADVTLTASTGVGLGYESGSFDPIFDADGNGSVETPSIQDGANASARIWVGPRVEVTLYGLAGVYAQSRFFLRADVDTSVCPWWTLTGGVEGLSGAFAEFNIFNQQIDIFDWDTGTLSKEFPIAQASGCAPSAEGATLAGQTWARSYGAHNIEHPVSLIATSDGGALVGGSTYSYTEGTLFVDALLVKLDALGHVAWQVGFDDLLTVVQVVPASDGYYLLAGEVSTQTEEPSVLMRLDLNGKPIWARALSADQPLDAAALAVFPDGSVGVAGDLGDISVADIWLARFDPDGELLWSMTLGGVEGDNVKSMIADSAGDLVVLCRSESYPAPPDDSQWALKVDDSGQVLWQAFYGAAHFDTASAVVEADGGYYLFGDLGEDAQVNRIDLDGNLMWAEHFDITTSTDFDFERIFSATALENGDVLVVGSENLGADSNLWAFRMNADGQYIWTRRYGGSDADSAGGFNQYGLLASTVAEGADGGLFVAGYTESFGTGNLDIWVLKLSSVGNVDLDPASGAFSSALGGLAGGVLHSTGFTSAVPAPLTLSVSPVEVRQYTPDLTVNRQGGID